MLEYIEGPFKEKRQPLPWQLQGLQETASGYGSKLTTQRMIYWAGRWRRVYAMCYSNCATLYILVKGKQLILRFS
jgi:hypothetical protein